MLPQLLNMLTCETIAVTAFLSTIDSLSAPCGLTRDYWDADGGNYLQNMDAASMLLRGLCWVTLMGLIVAHNAQSPMLSQARNIGAVYLCVATYLLVATLIAASTVMGLDCPNSDNTLSCDGDATYWMVPRNYCAAQIANNAGCKVDEPHRVQMCVRLGRAPLVNGALAAWFMRTLLPDALRVFLLVYYYMEQKPEDDTTVDRAGTRQRRESRNNAPSDRTTMQTTDTLNDVLAQPSTMLHEQDTLLSRDDRDVIRQSPHLRKRDASAYNIQF